VKCRNDLFVNNIFNNETLEMGKIPILSVFIFARIDNVLIEAKNEKQKNEKPTLDAADVSTSCPSFGIYENVNKRITFADW
jgi:hypothetical protein